MVVADQTVVGTPLAARQVADIAEEAVTFWFVCCI